ncbi:hypothetical protein RRG08_061618 [Elysia crispata]|uniref:Uncharacterized protein n=1 Tax=Elysia crispata TaxID=231223 RepID=A0AAE1A322_9GAST|nr:hypothetical protein RRG08_061618 [Elysia crispata]
MNTTPVAFLAFAVLVAQVNVAACECLTEPVNPATGLSVALGGNCFNRFVYVDHDHDIRYCCPKDSLQLDIRRARSRSNPHSYSIECGCLTMEAFCAKYPRRYVCRDH